MSLTLADAIIEVRATLNEEEPEFWDDDELTSWLQEGVRQFSTKTLMVEDTESLDPLIENQLRYTVADETWIGDLLEIYTAIYDDGSNTYKGLIKVHPRQIGNVATFTSGTPKYYSMHDRSLYIWPLSTAAIAAAGTISFLFAKETDDITALTDEYQHLAITYAIAKAKQKDQKFTDSSNLFSQFWNDVNFERADKHDREVESYSNFKIPMNSGGQGNAPTV